MKTKVLIPEVTFTKKDNKPSLYVGGGMIDQNSKLLGYYTSYVNSDGTKPEIIFVNNRKEFQKRALITIERPGFLVIVKRYNNCFTTIFYKFNLEFKQFEAVKLTKSERVLLEGAINAFKEETFGRNYLPVYAVLPEKKLKKHEVLSEAKIEITILEIEKVAQKLKLTPFDTKLEVVSCYRHLADKQTYYVLDTFFNVTLVKTMPLNEYIETQKRIEY